MSLSSFVVPTSPLWVQSGIKHQADTSGKFVELSSQRPLSWIVGPGPAPVPEMGRRWDLLNGCDEEWELSVYIKGWFLASCFRNRAINPCTVNSIIARQM